MEIPLRFTTRSLMLWVSFVMIAIAFGKLAFHGIATQTRILHAEEQVQIFNEMCVKAQESPPREAVRYLLYVRDYYPSGTKHPVGSPLDTMVETARTLAIQQIIDALRRETGEDLGNDAESWIHAFSDATAKEDSVEGKVGISGGELTREHITAIRVLTDDTKPANPN